MRKKETMRKMGSNRWTSRWIKNVTTSEKEGRVGINEGRFGSQVTLFIGLTIIIMMMKMRIDG